MNLPNFFILGAPKCGTSSLYHYLRQHPDVCFSDPKEPFFFEAEYERGPAFYWANYFGACIGKRSVGDASPRNLYLPYVPARIHDLIPDAKFIAILRNPVARAYSAWWMNVTLGREKLAFEAAVEQNLARLGAGDQNDATAFERLWCDSLRSYRQDQRSLPIRTYLDMGYYAPQLKRYYQLFPREQFKVLLFEDLCRSPRTVTREVWNFLGLDSAIEPEDEAPHMASAGKFSSALVRTGKRLCPDRYVPASLKGLVRRGLARLGGKKPVMNLDTRQALLEHYHDYNGQLEVLLGMDLTHWKT